MVINAALGKTHVEYCRLVAPAAVLEETIYTKLKIHPFSN